MDLRLRYIGLLRCFDAAARHQSYSLAAKELSISQAAVSQQIRSLEQRLAVKLFSRQGRAMQLTDQGLKLQTHVSQAFSVLLQGFDQIQLEPEQGNLVVTTTLSFASIWLVPRLWKFAEVQPAIKVKVMVSEELEDVRHSGIDIAIRQGKSDVENVSQERLFTDPVFPVCSPKLLEDTNLSSPQDIDCCQLIEVEDPGKFSWKNWFAVADAEYQPDRLSWIEAMSWEMGINSVMSGQGICLASSIMTKHLIDKGFLVRPFAAQIEPGLRFSFIHDPESPRVRRISLFKSWLKQELEDYLDG